MIGLLATLTFTVPLIGGLLLFKLDERKADAVMLGSFIAAMLLQFGVLTEYLLQYDHETVHLAYITTERLGEAYGIIIDPMSVLIGTVVALAGFIFMFYGMEYMSERNVGHPAGKGRGLFYAWMTLFEGATLGFIYSSTFLGLLIFFELMGLACWGVVSYYNTPAGRRAGFKAFIIPNVGAMIGFYTAIGIGITQLHDLSLFSLSHISDSAKPWLFLALLIAGYTKSAQFPTYSWIPDAMEAPTPASAFLHGAAMVEMGVYLVARVLQFIGPLPTWIFYFMATMVSLTLLIPILNYPVQNDAKRLLAYSTVAEAGIMFVGLTFATLGLEAGLKAAMFQLTTHAFVKGLAFLTAGTFTYSLGTLDMRKIRGLKDLLPINALAWSVALLGLAGLPPMAIAFSKAELLTGLDALKVTPLAWLPVLMVLADSAVFLWVGVKWITWNIFGRKSVERASTHPIITASLITLIVLVLVVPYLTYPIVHGIGFFGGGH
ncbi:hydrogenase 4 subunit D [Thermococcus waiotapuensis]|uniref:Hydrogenase 4 subunit D n=1 Tax=Thermococcus waiotapuensis TaxID=90909 RepID=A0AAE4T3L4_9EURY|nr:hydrogenase 4 subunit D [Thermococcus waiotapuensis]MDV3103881.1 hydrogenase 4 subunit D [Thermococcus waiotapuensis]